ncbi:septal ring lytic transglycosylase RlpA family protein [Allorhizobium undicola]|uniref:septal ring lytic transglycosylase RlpA family protein n=1 Tax=Allorhizobium undicola TaxID=78527 RepID=UPI003D33F606
MAMAVLATALTMTPLTAFAQTTCGGASWYSAGSRTASGERMSAGNFTAAHKYLPFGSRVKVTNRNNGKTVVVRINDRGPFIHGRVLDLSKAAAADIGMVSSGTAKVCYELVG